MVISRLLKYIFQCYLLDLVNRHYLYTNRVRQGFYEELSVMMIRIEKRIDLFEFQKKKFYFTPDRIMPDSK